MDKSTEKYLKKLISETSIGDVGEMARRPTNLRGDKSHTRRKTLWKDTNPTPAGGQGTPDGWIINPKITGDKGLPFDEFEQLPPEEQQEILNASVLIVPIDCEEVDDFLNKDDNRQWVESMEEKYNMKADFQICRRKGEPYLPKDHWPIEKIVSGGYKPTGERYSESERIKRRLFDVISNEIENESFSEALNKRSIPTVVSRDRKNVNQYGKFTNQKIEYSTHNYNAYGSVKDFLAAAIARVKGQETPEMKTFYMARQYNTRYNNWRADKKMEKKYEGKTEKYMLDAFGLEEQNLDVTIRMDFEIFGEPLGENGYTWNLRMTTKIGKKLEEETGLKGGFLDDKTIQSTTTAQLAPGTQFSDTYTVMDNPEIVKALTQAMEDLKSKVESIDPKETLKVATVKRYQINPNQGQLNESIKKKLIDRIVQKVTK